MLDGLEWNVRLVERENPQLFERFAQVFNSYWEDSDFEHLPKLDEQGKLPTLADALMRARSSGPGDESRILQPLSYVHLEVRAWAHQQLILNQLAIQSTIYDYHRNLVVAATGTGKTIIAALDFKRLSQQNQKNTQGVSELPSLLFVVHRSQILTQALQSFRTVLGSGNFGELLVDGYRPDGETTTWRHVFASVQSLHQNKLPELSTDQFQIIIVDEFHHAEANTYQ
ncbi:MAG: DEAD/DEAH box helicase family protein [Granulosicoccus sp.]